MPVQDLSTSAERVPSTMLAAVYRNPGSLSIEKVPVPPTGPGEVLLRVGACGVCGTDLKKIHYGLQSAPRIFGHEMAGTVACLGKGVDNWAIGDRAALLHHVACSDCFYCKRGLDAQCAEYRRTATTAGFEPAGGGFAEYVLATPTAVGRGMVRVPADVALENATFIEPVNTCLKGIRRVGGQADDLVMIFGLGPIGMLLSLLARLEGYLVVGIDPIPERRALAEKLGDIQATNGDTDALADLARSLTQGRGADAAIVATPAVPAIQAAIKVVRPGGRVILFANTRTGESAPLDVGDLCVGDKEIVGSYSSSMDCIEPACRLIFGGKLPVTRLITHRFPLTHINDALVVASHPTPGTMKVIINPTPSLTHLLSQPSPMSA